MSRPSDAHSDPRNGQATRERIIDAARELMIELGVLEVSVAEITQRAGVNVALVSYHFGGREGLMLSIAREDARLAMSNLARLKAADLTATEKIHNHVTGIIHAYYKRPYLNRLLQKLIREGSPSAAEEVSDFFVRPVAEARAAIILEGMASGEFRPVEPRLIGYALEGACAQIFTSSASREAVLGDGTLSPELVAAYAKSTADLIVRGLLSA
ncbi:TetR family transcriptional regulator [Novosphingobium sp.]|uniref:TetR family transcriptional regulator n=1 Tax=Novosphingobium sp. TaxID=1874826 RepID=UPI0038BCE50E